MRIRDLKGLGPKTEAQFQALGVLDVSQFLATDPFELYRLLKTNDTSTSLNALYAIIGAHQNKHWHQVAREQKTEILLRLEEMGLV